MYQLGAILNDIVKYLYKLFLPIFEKMLWSFRTPLPEISCNNRHEALDGTNFFFNYIHSLYYVCLAEREKARMNCR